MNRLLALLLALVVASVTVSSACVAAPSDWIRFTLEGDGQGNHLRGHFWDGDGPRHNDWSSSFVPSQLVGFELASFNAPGSRQLRFSLRREAGRADCYGNGGSGRLSGNCSFTPDPAFTQLLLSRGIGRPTREQAFGLMALNVHRDIVDAFGEARYPTPTVDDLMALTAVGVTGNYISGLARAGYHPRSIHSLVEFAALKITPEWIGSFARAGYGNLSAEELVQLRALNVTPEFIRGYERLGYQNLPANMLVQLKALNVTPEFVRSHVAQNAPLPPVSELVQMKVFGARR